MRSIAEIESELKQVNVDLAKYTVEMNSKKLTINGSFGKFGSQYSFLFAPKLLTQTTITGQLALLMLIESLENNGVSVVSANTDGIVVKHHSELTERTDSIVKQWENTTGYVMEETRYSELYSRDVNNYLAVKGDSVKGKGIFADPSMSKNPSNQICYSAIKENALYNTPIEQTIRECDDITKFLTVRTVKGGAVKDGEEVGKVIRWYYSTEVDGTLNYKTNGNKVPRSENGRPLMNLPNELPNDIDYQWYIDETYQIMNDCNYKEKEW